MIAFIMTFARNGANGAQPVSPKLLKIEVKGLQRQIHEQELPAENIERFVQRVKRNRHDRKVPSRVMRKLVCRFWLNEVSRQ